MQEQYLKTDPWKIIEQEWNPEKVIASESIFSLGMELWGCAQILKKIILEIPFKVPI